jgi:hypothetical protein
VCVCVSLCVCKQKAQNLVRGRDREGQALEEQGLVTWEQVQNLHVAGCHQVLCAVTELVFLS